MTCEVHDRQMEVNVTPLNDHTHTHTEGKCVYPLTCTLIIILMTSLNSACAELVILFVH